MASDNRYIVKATVKGGYARWLSEPRLGGYRTFAERQFAERFETDTQANDAILAMRSTEDCRGLRFTIETVDCSAGMPSSS
jgi:hypothetical protein